MTAVSFSILDFWDNDNDDVPILSAAHPKGFVKNKNYSPRSFTVFHKIWPTSISHWVVR